MKYYIPQFASAYGSCTFGSQQFQDTSNTCSGTTSGSSSSAGSSAGGGLTNTGFDIILAATLACVIIGTAIVVRFIRRPAKPSAK